MSLENPDFESQWKGSPLAEAMGEAYRVTKEFYLEYVTADYNHEHVAQISKSVALAMVNASPYNPMLGRYKVTRDRETGEILDVMNKGAIRITPSSKVQSLLGEDGTPNAYKLDETQLWVYRHDYSWYLTRPRTEPRS